MSSDRRAALKKLKNMYLSPKIDLNDFRLRMDDVFSSVFLPNNVEYEETSYRTIKCDCISPVMFSSNRVLLYVHGGSFVAGSRAAYRPFVAALANATASKAYLPEFRLAPSQSFAGRVFHIFVGTAGIVNVVSKGLLELTATVAAVENIVAAIAGMVFAFLRVPELFVGKIKFLLGHDCFMGAFRDNPFISICAALIWVSEVAAFPRVVDHRAGVFVILYDIDDGYVRPQ